MQILAACICMAWLFESSSSFTPTSTSSFATRVASSPAFKSSRIIGMAATTEVPEGMIKTITKPGDGKAVRLGDIATISYTCYLPSDTTSTSPFARATKQKMVVGDGTMIPGWDKALRSMTVGERSIIRVIDPNLGYGSNGVPPLIPADSELEFDVEVFDSQPQMANIDFDNLAMADSLPRTASDISAAYEARQALKALEGPKKEGLEGFIEKAKNFYFFGLFEGETGQQAPWFLRPSITFPLAFLIVAAAFYVSYVSGAITERGASVKDELDEIILSSASAPGLLVAMSLFLFGQGL